MNLVLRRGTAIDAEACGRIIYDAFKALADKHKFAPDFPSAEIAAGRVSAMLSHPGARNHELLSWCLGKKLRLVYQMTLMTTASTMNRQASGCRPYCTKSKLDSHALRPFLIADILQKTDFIG